MIVKSILDTDLYKFTTSYAYMKLFPQAKGTFEFFDRDNTEYPDDFVQRVYLELGNLGMLHLTKDELEYMTTNCRFVPQVYWEWLSSFHFNSGKVQVWLDDAKRVVHGGAQFGYKHANYMALENWVNVYDSAGQIMHPHHEMAESDCWSQLCSRHGEDVVNKVWNRHLASEFKRQKSPIFIPRSLYA